VNVERPLARRSSSAPLFVGDRAARKEQPYIHEFSLHPVVDED